VHPGPRDLAGGEQPGQLSVPVHIGDHAAAAVVRARDHRDGLPHWVDTGFSARGSDGWETSFEVGNPAGIEIYAGFAGHAQPGVDSGSHHVARRQITHRMHSGGN
jgi:hypothetical protein